MITYNYDNLWLFMNQFYPLLNYLTHQKPLTPINWQNWYINRIADGANNLVYRVRDNTVDLAVKFTIKDSRNRASREYHALLALQQAKLAIAPKPILLDLNTYQQPIIIQTWLNGEVNICKY